MNEDNFHAQLHWITDEIQDLKRSLESMETLVKSLHNQSMHAQLLHIYFQDIQQENTRWIEEIAAHLKSQAPRDVTFSRDGFVDPEDVELFCCMEKVKQTQSPQHQARYSQDEVTGSDQTGTSVLDIIDLEEALALSCDSPTVFKQPTT